jgi:hypothetical protein
LWNTAKGRVIRPILQVARVKHGFDEAYEAFILNFLFQ